MSEPHVEEQKKKSRFRFGGKKKKDPEIAVFETLEDAARAAAAAEPEAKPADIDDTLTLAGYTDADTPAQTAPEPESEPKITNRPVLLKHKRSTMTLRSFYIAVAAIAFIILSLVAATILITHFAEPPYPKGSVVLTQPADDAVSDYIFTSKMFFKDNKEMRLLGVLPDRGALVMYFNRYIEPAPLDFYITDNNGKNYYLDLSKHPAYKQTNKLYFRPLDEGVESFELFLPDYILSGYEETLFFFTEPLQYKTDSAAFAAAFSKTLNFANETAVLSLDTVKVSEAGAFIGYSVFTTDGLTLTPELSSRGMLHASDLASMPAFSLLHKASDNAIMGNSGFWPPKGLSDKFTASISNLICRFEVDELIVTDRLFLNDPAHTIRIPLDEYTIVMERMGKRGNAYVLVLHTLDPSGNRVAGKYDMELIGTNRNGGAVYIQSDAYVSEQGSDYLFIDNDNEIVFTEPSDVKVRIKAAEITLKPVVFNIEPAEFTEYPDSQVLQITSAIEEYFTNTYGSDSLCAAQVVGLNLSGDDVNAVVYVASGTSITKYYVSAEISGSEVIINQEITLDNTEA